MWSSSWCDRKLRFHAYDLVSPTAGVEELLAEVDRDPTGSVGRAQPRVLRGRSLISSRRVAVPGVRCGPGQCPLGK
ncbi:MAG: DUF3024 domain-containing protein [Mycobacterium sp.]|uniref:DUF3024 domain-containing protein n=1 Tax=Mycobacterium sp. TaxID=1785 RepID=UPI0026051C93|nr:DUF3024 domain-containing protein [Mycobacterium sp.]MDI3313425.1 DUF3024 domain-containing protein [Mycobacterium sp.]